MIEKLKIQITSIQDKLIKCQEFLQNLKIHVQTIENEIEQMELLKCHVCFYIHHIIKIIL